MAKLLVTGSIAYDRISVLPDKFGNHILPKQVHNLNVCFMANEMNINYGGTGGNVAYNLNLLGEKPILLASIGKDGSEYLKYLKSLKISTSHIVKSSKLLTANATIMTDLDDNQITSFYAGAMMEAHKIKLSTLKSKPSMAIISPNDPKAMLQTADYCFKKNIPFIADPGQTIPAFSKLDLMEFITGAHALVVNDYELELLKVKTEMSLKEILEGTNFLIVTYGDKGSKIWGQDATVLNIPAYKAKKVEDPTGCGDAYRAGLMYGYQNNFDIEASAKIGAWIASKCVEKKGTQNHKITKTDFNKFLKQL